jgi:hypothetical protein
VRYPPQALMAASSKATVMNFPVDRKDVVRLPSHPVRRATVECAKG